MEINNILNNSMSKDRHLVWSASWELINLNSNEVSAFPLTKIPEVRNAILAVNNFANEDVFRLAIAILNNLEKDICRCNSYSLFPRLLPTDEEERHFVSIETMKEDTPWEPVYICHCNMCSNKYRVQVNHGYHFPVASWVKLT